MTRDEAVTAAEAALRRLERPDLPLRLNDPEFWSDRDWCFVFPFNSVSSLDNDRPEDAVPTGALLVPKDGSPASLLPTALSVDEALHMMESRRK